MDQWIEERLSKFPELIPLITVQTYDGGDLINVDFEHDVTFSALDQFDLEQRLLPLAQKIGLGARHINSIYIFHAPSHQAHLHYSAQDNQHSYSLEIPFCEDAMTYERFIGLLKTYIFSKHGFSEPQNPNELILQYIPDTILASIEDDLVFKTINLSIDATPSQPIPLDEHDLHYWGNYTDISERVTLGTYLQFDQGYFPHTDAAIRLHYAWHSGRHNYTLQIHTDGLKPKEEHYNLLDSILQFLNWRHGS